MIEDVILILSESKYFTVMDIKRGYYQIILYEGPSYFSKVVG